MTDQELIDAANEGDADAMEEIYIRYRQWVYSLAHRFCGNREDALEVLQEVFIYLFNKFPGFRLQSQLKTFLYPAVKNISLSRLRKQRRVIPLDPSQARRIPDHRPDPETQWKDLADLLKGLSEEEQELVFLRFYDGFTLAEISELLGLPLGTVKSRLHRTLDRLRRHLKKE